MIRPAPQKPAPFTVRTVNWNEAADTLSAIRRQVFIQEQQVPEELEWDRLDAQCIHALAEDGEGNPIGTGRLLPDGHIGRLAVLKSWRRRGVGSALLLHLMQCARKCGITNAALNAQTYAIGFYQRHGFRPEGEIFMDAGIPHQKMTRAL